jgi:hypothetical protein
MTMTMTMTMTTTTTTTTTALIPADSGDRKLVPAPAQGQESL